MAAARGLLSAETLDRMLGLLAASRPPDRAPTSSPCRVDADRLLAAIERIRLIRGGGYRFVLPIDLGETVIADDVSPERAARGAGATAASACRA